MVSIGSLAPEFDCLAVIGGSARTLPWGDVHRGRTLVLLFDSIQSRSNLLCELAERPGTVEELARIAADLCIVCREPTCELVSTEIPYPLIDDSTCDVAALYGILRADGTPLWGHCIVDADGFVRRLVQCDVAVTSTVEELLVCVAAAADVSFMDTPC